MIKPVPALICLAFAAAGEQTGRVISTDTARVSEKQSHLAQPIGTPEDAVAMAIKYTGLGNIKRFSSITASEICRKTTVTDDVTPFLSEQINGRQVWEVTFDSVRFELPGWDADVVGNQTPKSIKVLIDPADGRLLRITAREPGFRDTLPAEPPAESAEKSLSGEIYHDFVSDEIPVDFMQACAAAVPSSPIMSKVLIAVCVNHSRSGEEPRPVWCIIGRGAPGVDSFFGPEGRGRSANDHVRSVVDAVSGELLYADNRPHVVR
jgi:hypothetical protein